VSTLIAAVRSLATYVAVAAYLLVVGPLALLIVVPLRLKGLLYEIGHVGAWLALGLAGIRYEVTGREHVPQDRSVVFCSNHQSNVDPPVLFRALHRRLHILYKAGLRRIPVLGIAMDVGGFVPVDRQNRDQALASIERAAASIRAGHSFLIFPEGTRSRSDALLPFKKGGFLMAIKAQAPIVPVAISGGREGMRRGSPLVRPARVRVRIGEPVETEGLTIDDRDTLIATVRERIERLLRQDHP
jgi:1-acyl-sn-glycerol-3-phosphate acyltransferase